jgi:hypothetical protein
VLAADPIIEVVDRRRPATVLRPQFSPSPVSRVT